MRHLSFKNIHFTTWISGICLLALHACKTPVIEPEPSLPPATGSVQVYPLDETSFPGFSGEFRMEKLSDGSASGTLKLMGFNPARRYFGKLSRIEGTEVIDVADLHELDAGGISLAHLKKDYANKPLTFDSLLILPGVVRVLEFNPEGGSAREVLRGDFGSNLILGGEKAFTLETVNSDQLSGSLSFRKRQNNSLLFLGNVAGLASTDVWALSYFRGNPAGQRRFIGKLGQISSESAGNFSINFPGDYPGLEALDTLRGFIGFHVPGGNPDTASLGAIVRFGGVKISFERSYNLYRTEDSSVVGKIKLQEIGGAGNLSLQFEASIPPSPDVEQYLSLHMGNSLGSPDKILAIKIPQNGKIFLHEVSYGSLQSGFVTAANLDQWNVHARIAGDTSGSLNEKGIADLGANEVLRTDSLASSLTEFNPQFNIGGSLIFRKRRNGDALGFVKLSNTVSGVENTILIRNGPKPASINDTTASVLRVAAFPGINPGEFKRTFNLSKLNGDICKWDEFLQVKAQSAYLEYSFSDSGDFIIISRGDL